MMAIRPEERVKLPKQENSICSPEEIANLAYPYWMVRNYAESTAQILERNWINAYLPRTQISEICELAETVFEDKNAAVSWLCEPNLATDDAPPLDLLGTEAGFDRVKNLLLRIQYGVLA